MSRRRVLLLTFAVVVLLVAAGVFWFALPRKVTVTLEVSAAPGATIQGTAEVDGQVQELKIDGANDPQKVVLTGYRVTYQLASADDSGQFQAWARLPDRTCGAGGSGSPAKNGLRGWVKSSWWGQPPASWFEVFNRDAPPAWLDPPPWAAAKPSS